MQKLTDAPLFVNVQHLLLVGSVQSAETWQIQVFDVSLHVPMCVTQFAAVEHELPNEAGLQLGKVPVPLPTATAQQTGVAPPHSSGPSQSILSLAGQDAGATQEKVVGGPGAVQQTVDKGQAVFPPQPKS